MRRLRARSVALVLAPAAALLGVVPTASADSGGAGEPDPRIVNGSLVDQPTMNANWPFIVSLQINIGSQGFRCGGSLVTPSVVVTAAHCMFAPSGVQAQASGITVRGGSIDLTTSTFQVGVIDLQIHPDYQPDDVGLGNDITLLRLASAVPAPPVPLAGPGDVPQSGSSDAAGWGCHEIDASGACPQPQGIDNLLRQATIPVQSALACNDYIGGDPFVDAATQVCAGSFAQPGGPGAPDTCFGDSGGPLVVRDGGGTRLVGITSYGFECGFHVGVYTGVGGFHCFLDPIVYGWDPANFPAPQPCPTEGTFVPMAPNRVIDTRNSTPLTPNTVLSIPILGVAGVPSSGVSAVSLNVTAVDPQADGFLTAFPCGQSPPLASNLNYVRFGTVANSVAVGVGGNGAVCVTSFATTDVVIDVSGYWLGAGQPAPGSRYVPISPVRMVDTRDDPAPLLSDELGVLTVTGLAPQAIGGVTLNVTVVNPAGDGFVTAFPCDAPEPLASNVNYVAGQTVANAVTVAASDIGEVCFTTFADTDLIIDATGWFGTAGGTTGGRFSPVAPARLLDTRTTTIVNANTSRAVPVAGVAGVPANAVAAVVNVTAAAPLADGFLAAFPCGQAVPATSTVNYLTGENVPNLAFVPIAPDGTICIFTFATSHVVVDVTGYVVP